MSGCALFTDETGERRLGSALERGVEPAAELTPRGERPGPSMSAKSSGSAARNRFIEPAEVPYLGRVLLDLFRIVFKQLTVTKSR